MRRSKPTLQRKKLYCVTGRDADGELVVKREYFAISAEEAADKLANYCYNSDTAFYCRIATWEAVQVAEQKQLFS